MAETKELAALVARIASAYVSAHKIELAALPGLLRDIHASLSSIAAEPFHEPIQKCPNEAAPFISQSITAEYLVCLEDGKRLKLMKRHLRSRYGLTPQEYRQKWGLPADYPMVAPSYAKQRSSLARKQGLGRSGSPEEWSQSNTAHSKSRSIGDGVVCTDTLGLVTFMNPTAERLTGWQSSQASGKSIADVLGLQNCSGCDLFHPAEQSIKSGAVINVEIGTVLVNRTGDKLDVSFSVAPLKTPLGEVIGSVTIFNDLTDGPSLLS